MNFRTNTIITLSSLLLAGGSTFALPINQGDVFASVGSGNVNHYDSSLNFLETINIGNTGFTTGMAFDAAGNLYVTGFSANTLAKFDTNATLVNSNFAAGLSTPESIAFDLAGNFFVGNVNNGIRKYSSTGAFLGTVINTRVDFIDLSADQSRFIYTQEGSSILTVSNAVPGVSGLNFASGLTPGEAFALRFLPDGGVLLADGDNIKRLSSAGAVLQTYDLAGHNDWFALNLDPDGTSFFSGDFSTSQFHKFDIATGNLLASKSTGTGASSLFGLTIAGERTVGGPGPGPDPVVPEPSSALAGLALSLVCGFARRRRA